MSFADYRRHEAKKGAKTGEAVWPFYLIGTRDSFTHHLVTVCTRVVRGGRSFVKVHRTERCAFSPYAIGPCRRYMPVFSLRYWSMP